MDAADRTQLTFRNERWRAVASGILETAANTFLLLVAVRYFAAGATAKALVAGGGSFGLLLSPVVVWWAAAGGRPASQAAATLFRLGAASFLVAALVPTLPVFVVVSVVAMACSSSVIPLLTQMYQDNYPAAERGRLFSTAFMIRIATTIGFGKLAGLVLGWRLESFRGLLLVFAGAFVLAAYCVARCPSQPLPNDVGAHPFRALRFARTDPLFRNTLISWMFMGFANLMMLPLRVEYLANPRYGLNLDVNEIAMLTVVIPNVARLLLSPVWGRLFDVMNFFALRITLNLGFALGFLAFFTSNSHGGLLAGAVLYGLANAGGDVAWSLWVTKFAPPGRVADYMSVHTFFTGVRGVIAPVAAFQLVAVCSLATLGWGSAALILFATLLLLPEIKLGRGVRGGAAVVEEVSD